MAERFDLFGDPVPENYGRRGRPAHIATLENRNKVRLLMGLGWGNGRIADALAISEPTLRKVYFRELKERLIARDRMDARIAEILWRSVDAGNVQAIKEFRKLVERNDLMTPAQAVRSAAKEKPAARLGKKEAAEQAAQTSHEGTPWSSLVRQ